MHCEQNHVGLLCNLAYDVSCNIIRLLSVFQTLSNSPNPDHNVGLAANLVHSLYTIFHAVYRKPNNSKTWLENQLDDFEVPAFEIKWVE